ncbi:MAG: DNA translocase FtsK [Spirochaetaceae bacterium]|nr:DNA translocase FtsK [Spirochaetaceae bacterium]
MLIILPGFYPRTTFMLGASALPFLVVAVFARISTEPGAFFENHPVFAAVGLSSLYAVIGFLFALSWVLLALGLVKLTERMKSAKAGTEIAAKKGKDARGGSRQARETWRSRFHHWREDRKLKRSQAEMRLRKSESLTGQTFDIDLPDLPPLDGLKTIHPSRPSPAESAGTSSMDQTRAGVAAVPLVASAASAAVQETAAVNIAPSGSAGAGQKTGTIEFTSVPPQKVSGAGAGADDPQKQALIQKIIERAKPKPYAMPIDGILNSYPDGQYWIIDDKTRRNAEVLRETLAEFNIEAEVTGIRKGPVITMFEILPAHGVKISKITNLSDNIALRLAASSVRIVAPIPGKHAVGIEVPNERRAIVSLREIIENEQFRTAKMEIPIVLGKDIAGEVQYTDLTQAPHLLIAGATGSGKSVCVNAIILSILYRRSPEEVKLMLIDPKIVELKLYNDIPHLLTPVITDSKRAFQALQYCISEMERRYSILDKAGVRDVKTYNKRIKERGLAQEKLPYIVVIIDEFADLMATTGKELESTLARLAAMARAVGIHLVLATQRPSIDVITGLIKANIPSRIAFMVASKFDSRIIIDMVGAEKLLGRGDMLFSGAQDPFPVRMQGAFVSEEEVERAVEYVKTLGEPEYIDDEIFYDEEEENAEPGLFDDGDGDPLFEKALEIVLQQGKASASFIQRRLKIGYNRAARLVELMEERGIVGPSQGSKPREVLHNPDLGGRPIPLRRDDEDQDDDSAPGGDA